ncbi:site-2 protease family protein [Picosynechococcus sp. PCC 7117]|uniref:site-2 protease family protein n=1 Tax=Picosynechococcus sp. PCC 7117 TaxID=195498 RepID=UPI0008105399|nr:site-2 protease family protein [Picosynechococcus sp. PCC 7117]ANV87388.1 peptidase M50 [Picosynechococcus sp. PCC 7117]
MEVWLLFFVMGVLTYALIRRTVPPENKAPLSLLWLVMMLPASAWLVWILIFGATQPMPLLLMLPLLILSPFMYWSLLDWGKPKPDESADPSPPPATPQTPSLDLEKLDQAAALKKEGSKLRPISTKEEKALRDCFPWGVYYLQNIDYYPQAILCRGKLRAVPQEAYQTIRDNIEQLFGDRFIVVFQESLRGQPFFALVPNPWKAAQQSQTKEEPLTRPDLAIALVLITLFTTTVMGLELQGVAPEVIQQNPSMLWQGLPYGLLLVAILGCHELGHYGAAAYYKIKTTLPYFVPIPFFIGTLGAYTQRKSPIPHRQALFDFAVAGSWVGMLLTLPCLWVGLGLSQVVPLPEESTLLAFNEFNPRFSLLLGLMSRLALGNQFTPDMALDLHPVAIAGYMALMLGGLQLLPIGQLDGGLMTHAVFGQRTASIIAQVTRICMIAIAFVQPNFLFLAIFALLMPIANQPALNDVTDLDNRRDLLGMFTLVFVALIFLPLPAGLSNWLNF